MIFLPRRDAPEPPPLRDARFRRRRNRFVVEIELARDTGGWEATTASLPNPGRLGEILLPDVVLGVAPGPPGGRHPWKVMSARLPSGETVFLDTTGTNYVARYLLENKLIPALSGYEVERAEAPLPGTRSRVDFLLRRCSGVKTADTLAPELRYLEVKSCTLFNGSFAMFPDAVTDRGRRHVEELAETGAGAVLFVVHSDQVRWFVPDFHTDLLFSRSLASARHRLPIIPVGVRWNADGTIARINSGIEIPWDLVEPHLEDRGLYAVLLSSTGGSVPVGSLGTIALQAGWYLYVGSAKRGLTARLNRHRRRGRKNLHWHIDYLREVTRWVEDYPIRKPSDAEYSDGELVAAFATIADSTVPGFGASDSSADSHLFYFSRDPRRSRSFVELILRERRRSLEARITRL